MAYVGTPIDTTNTFQSLTGDRFDGDGSAVAFTLSTAPASTLDIEVFVGNVRQDPNSAYTVSGTTLTFTGAPPSGTNNIYVVHQAKAVGTIDPPATETIAKTFSGGVTLSGTTTHSGALNVTGAFNSVGIDDNGDATTMTIDTSENVNIGDATNRGFGPVQMGNASTAQAYLQMLSSTAGNIHFGDATSGDARFIGSIVYRHDTNLMKFQTNGATGLQIDSTGAVTKPLQPAASYRGDAEANLTGDGTQKTIGVTSGAGVTELWDNNADLSGGTFTAPVTGKYLITGQVFIEDIASNHDNMLVIMETSNRSYYIALNISTLGRASASSFGFPFCAVADMDANDTHVLKLSVSGGSKVIDMVDLFTCQVTLLG